MKLKQVPQNQFLFIRHGETIKIVDPIKESSVEEYLSMVGKLQIRDLCPILRSIMPIDKRPIIFSSPLLRAKETAEILKARNMQMIIYDNNLSPDAETVQAFYQRIRIALHDINDMCERNKFIIVVSHSRVFKAFSKVLQCEIQSIKKGQMAYFTKNDDKWSADLIEITNLIEKVKTID